MFIIAMIVVGLMSAVLLGLLACGLYISIMEPASPGEQQWQQGEGQGLAGSPAYPPDRRKEAVAIARDGKFTHMPHA